MSSPDAVLELRLDSFAFAGASREILRDIRLSLGRGERVAVMGPSASGKTTLLKILAGLKGYEVTAGMCRRSGKFSMLFQDNVVLDYLSVRKNISLPSELDGGPIDISEISQSLHIEHLLDAFPRRLSGGERKRVALARGLAYPGLIGLIMDEPFVAMDLSLKEAILVDLKRRLDEAQLACVFASHSPEEAVYLGQRIVFLSGTPTGIAHSMPIDLPGGDGSSAFQRETFQRLVLEVASVMRSMNLATSL